MPGCISSAFDKHQVRRLWLRAEQSDALSMSRIFDLDTRDVGLICLCFVGGATSAQIRYVIRSLRRKMPQAFILVAPGKPERVITGLFFREDSRWPECSQYPPTIH